MIKFGEKYPLLHRELSLFIIENQLDLQQIRGIVRRAIVSNPALADEINAAFSDDSICWRKVLDDPQIGEVFSTDSEALARDYARQMFLQD